MKNLSVKFQALALFVAGTLLIIVATVILVSPAEFYAANSIGPGMNASLLNELKAPAGFLLVAGLFMFAAIFARGLADAALALAAMIYLSYAGSRFASMLVDGIPTEGLVQAAVLEAVIGGACLVVAAVRRPNSVSTAWR